MRAELIQQRDILARELGQILQQPRNDPLVGRGAGDVGERDADFVGRLDPFAQRLGGNRRLQRRHDGGLFIRQAGIMRWGDDRDAIVRQIELQMAAAVSEINFHVF